MGRPGRVLSGKCWPLCGGIAACARGARDGVWELWLRIRLARMVAVESEKDEIVLMQLLKESVGDSPRLGHELIMSTIRPVLGWINVVDDDASLSIWRGGGAWPLDLDLEI